MKQKEVNEKHTKFNESNESNESCDNDSMNDSSEINDNSYDNNEDTEDNVIYFDNKKNNYLCNNYKFKSEFKINDNIFINIDHYLYYCEYNYDSKNKELNKKLNEYCNYILNCDTFNKVECLYKKKYASNANSLINKKKKDLGYLNKIIKKYEDIKKDNNWNNKKIMFMKKGLLEKFKDEKLKKLLLSTENKKLIYKKDKNNILGVLLMELRDELKN
jgi:predicted NAD-dependent protein-ADP-ribosyltransferase YbiA (DUF1768 family)